MARTLTAANAVYMLTIPGLYDAPQQIQRFATDDIFSTNPLESAEVSMGVDGYLSAGFVFREVVQSVQLQSDSQSVDIFENWWAASQVARDVYEANGVLLITAIQKKWTMTRGFLTTFPPTPDGGKILKPRRFTITWNSIQPSAVV